MEDGTLVYFIADDEPQKHHAVQVWQTPIVGPNFVPEEQSDSYLFKIGNRDIVRGMADGEVWLSTAGLAVGLEQFGEATCGVRFGSHI